VNLVGHINSYQSYNIYPMDGPQVPNRGDSGGPLFKNNDTSVVYGAVSNGIMGEDLYGLEVIYTVSYSSVHSNTAKEFYRKIFNDEEAPKSLKNLLRPCL